MMRSVWVSMISDLFSVSTSFPPPSRRPAQGYQTTESQSATDSETTQRRIEKAKRFGERLDQPLTTATSALGQPAPLAHHSNGSAEPQLAAATDTSSSGSDAPRPAPELNGSGQIPWMAAKLSVGVHWRIRQQAPRSTSLARFCSALEAYPMRTGPS